MLVTVCFKDYLYTTLRRRLLDVRPDGQPPYVTYRYVPSCTALPTETTNYY